MNIKKLILAVTVLTATGAVFAQGPYAVDKPAASTKTRAEVIAELAQARKLRQEKIGNRVDDLYSRH